MADNEKLNPLEELAAYHANAPRFMKGSPFVNNRDEFNDVTNWIPSEQNRPYDTGRQDENGNPIMDSPVNDAFRVEDAPVNTGKSAGTILVEGLQSLRQEENDPLQSLAGKPLFATMGNFASGLVPEGFKESKLYADYFYGADEKREAIAHATELYRQGLIKVNPEALGLASSEQQRKLWESMMKQVHFVEKLQNLKDIPGTTDESGKVDMRKVLAQFPEIKDVLEQKGTNAAVLALMEAKHIKKIDEVYSNEFTRFFGSVATGAERGVYSFVKQAVGTKAALGAMLGNRNKDAFTKDEQAILSDMDKRLSGLAENSYTGVGSAVGGAIGSALENAPLVVTSVIGTYLGGAAAVAAGASAPIATAAGSALAIGLMGLEIGGSQYEQNANKRDKTGRRMYTPEQAAYLSMTQGIAEGVLEQYTLKQIGKAITGRPAMKELADLYSNAAIKDLALVAGKGASEAELKAQTYALVEQTLKDMASAGMISFKTELFEEFSQQVSDMVIENAFQLALKGENAELSSMQDILSQSIYAAAEAVPAVAGFGMFGMAGHGMAHRKQLTSPRQYIGSLRDSLVQNVMNNQHLAETIEGVGANLKNLEELQGKAPEVVRQILDSNNERFGIKDSYLDIKSLKQEEGGAELVEAIAKQAGISAEELQACEAGTGILKVSTSVLMQVSSTAQDKAKGILFRNVTKESTMKTNKQAEEEIENIKQALAILNGKADIDADEAVKKYVDGMFQDQVQAQKAMEILRADIENPHAELKKRLKAVQGEIDTELEATIKQLQAGMKQGVDIMRTLDDQSIRTSNNAQWYRNWYADNKKEITKAELERIAYENATGQATRYADGVTNDGSPEAQQYFSEVKAKLDGLMAERDTLQSLAPSLKWIQKGDVIAASTLTAEGVNVYRQVKETLLQGNKNVSSAAAASALLFARQAERAAKYHQEAGEKDYTAQDYLMQIVANAQGMDVDLAQMQSQAAAVRQQYEGTDQWMKAPNGQQTNLTERQWLQVRTPAFKAWFGDWENDPENASKVVDENGEPLVVYHSGTFAKGDNNIPNGFMHFGTHQAALDRGNSKLETAVVDVEKGKDGKYHFSIDDNLTFSDKGYSTYDDALDAGFNAISYKRENLTGNEDSIYNVTAYFLNIKNPLVSEDMIHEDKWQPKLDEVASGKYDGIFYKNEVEDEGSISYIAKPGNIKSATANNGNFSLTDDNIYYQAQSGITAPVITYAQNQQNIKDAINNKPYDEFEATAIPISILTGIPHKQTDMLKYATDLVTQLSKSNIVDPLGKKIIFAPAANETMEDYALHLISSSSRKIEGISYERAVALSIARQIIKNPDVIIDEPSRAGNPPSRVYMSLIQMGKDTLVRTIVSVSGQNADRVVTIYIVKNAPTGTHKYSATKEFVKFISNATNILYIKADVLSTQAPRYFQGLSTGTGLSLNSPIILPQDWGKINVLPQKTGDFSSVKGAYSQAQNLIALFQAADQSTFMHESAHAYLEDLRKLAEQFPESQAAKDYATIMAWAQWKEGDAAAYAGTASAGEFAKREAEIKEALKNGFVERKVEVNGQEQTIRVTADELKAEWAQERFARGFEVYLQSGTAPSSTLVRAFSRFKSWLTRIYKDVTGAGVRASSEVEAIMARMVAADDEIENYALVKRAQRIQDIDADLLDTDTQAMLQRWEDQAKEDAKAKLLAQLIKEFKEADTKKHMDDYKKQLEDMARDMDVFKAEAVAKVSGEQAVVAMGFYKSVADYQQDLALHDGGYDAFIDTELKGEAERYKQQLPNAADLQQRAEDAYNSGNYATQLAALEAEILGRRIEKYANAPKKLAAAMDDVEQALAQEDKPLEKAILALKYAFRWETKQAEKIALLQDLVEELKQASKEDRQKIKDEMTTKVKELKAETMQNKAWLRGVRDAAVGKAKAHREAAKQRLSNMSIREATNTRAWIREADKAGKQCLKAITAAVSSKDDATKQAKYKEAQDAKIRQSVYTAMAAESVRLKRTSQRLIVPMKQRAKAAPKNKRLDAINKYYLGHTLYMFGLKSADNLKPTGLQPLQDVLKNLAVQGFDCNVDQAILQEAGGTQPSRSYSDLNITELAEVADLVDFLYVSGVNLGKLLTTEEYLPDVVTKLLQAHDEATALEQDRKAREKDGINDYMLRLLKPEVMLRLLDSKQGLFVKYIYQPLFEGQDKKRVLSEQSAEQLKTILDNWMPSEQRKELTEVWETLFDGQELTKENIIAMALNWGNKANRQRLLAGLNYGKETTERFVQEADVLEVFDKHMVKADWEFVQQIWDYIGQYGDDVNQVVQDCTGNPMERVQADPFDILSADGERISLKGGYYPIKRDPSKSSVQQELEVQNQASGGQVLGMSMGSTKSRAKGDVAMGPLLLEMGVISRHVDQQIHIITMRKACLDAYRLLRQTQVANAITQQFGEKSHRILLKWVEDVWHEPMGENDILSGWGERLRGNTIKAIMAYRVSTAMLNFANVVPMADRLGVANTVKALMQFMANPRQMREFVMQDSAFMRDRANNLDRDLRTQQSKMLGSNKYMDAIDKYSNWLIAETDLLCGVPTYNWAYQESYSKAIAEGASAAEAAKRARFDAHEAVRSVLGSADSIDQAAIQRSKSLFIKALTPFYSFFNAQMNAVWVKYYEGRYGGQTIVTTDPAGNVTRTPVKEAFMKRYSGFMYSLLMRHVLMAGIETCIRTGLDVLSAGHDDRPEKDPWARFIKQWSINSVDSAVGGFPVLNGAVSACFYALMGENKMASRGVTDAAVERMIKPFVKAGEAAGRGKGIDPLEYARMTTKGIGGSVFGIPDTLTDGVFNTARFLLDDYRLMDPADLREYIGRTLLDKRLKAK